ncbi:unnamed protein product [Penicillium salamii]|nr:unnamed protein product [Penicillium salamii]
MARTTRRINHPSPGTVSEVSPLLKRSTRKTEKGPHQHLKGRMSTRNFQTQPPLESKPIPTLRLRIRQEYLDPGPEEYWWMSLLTPDLNREDRRHKQLKENTDKEQVRLDWLQRLRPKPHRRLLWRDITVGRWDRRWLV